MVTNNEDNLSERTPILGTEKLGLIARIPARYIFAALSFWGIFVVYVMRVNLHVSIVGMVISPLVKDESDVVCLELTQHMLYSNTSAEYSEPEHQGQFDWDTATQGLILGSFFYGYIITQIPGGIISERYGAKWLFGMGVLITSIFTLLTPLAAQWGVGYLIAARFIEGLGEGVTYPAMNALIGRWVPKNERSRISTLIHCGSPLGSVFSLFVSGMLADSGFLGGWPSVFYVSGIMGCLWFVFWITLIHESPQEHPRISKSELAYILEGQDHVQNYERQTPWRSILTSLPVWALVFTHFGYSWGFYTLLTELPTYLSNVLHFNLKKNGTLSALPYLIQSISAFMASIVADRMRASGKFRITTLRKAINSIAFYGPGLIILSVAFVGCHPAVIVALLTISVGLSGFVYSGFNITHVDMSPEFAGTLMGITNCVANMSGFLAPAYVGWIIKDGQTLENWAIVFITSSVIYFLAGTIYNMFGSAEPQPWGNTTHAAIAPAEENPSIRKSYTEPNAQSSEP